MSSGPQSRYWMDGTRVSFPWMAARIACTLLALLVIVMICKRIGKYAPTPRGFEITPTA